MSPCDGEDENVEHQGHRRGSITSGFLWRIETTGPIGPEPFRISTVTTSDSLPHLPDLWCTPSPQHVSKAMGDIHSPLAHLNRRCEGKEEEHRPRRRIKLPTIGTSCGAFPTFLMWTKYANSLSTVYPH